MKWLAGVLLLACGACSSRSNACPVVALAGATPHSVAGEVASAVLAAEPRGRRVCIEVFRHRSYDSVGDPAAEVAMAERVAAQDDVMAVVGHATSSGSLAAAPVYRSAGITQLVPTATSRLLAQFRPSAMSLAPDDSLEGLALAAFGAQALRAHRAFVFYVANEYAEGLLGGLRVGLAGRNVAVTAAARILPESDLPTLVDAAIRRQQADIAYLIGDYRTVGRLAQVLHARRRTLPLVAGDAALYPEGLAEQAGEALPSLRVVGFQRNGEDSARSAAYLAAFRRIAGREPTPDEMLTHDALMVAVAAVRTAGPDRAAVESWLASLGGSRPAWRGVTGPVQFAHPADVRFGVFRIQDGIAVPVTPR
ncbi:MAG TPA: ABC transporter substrate-binding protein [Gemmatimonadales bacterium]|nr:ABC transporter substrate-binding protein [Gemmatimonadales bacterium]